MPRAIWKGAVSFGLVSIPIRLFSATEEKDVSFRQVHSADGGRVRYQRVCEKCGEVVAFAVRVGERKVGGDPAEPARGGFDGHGNSRESSEDVSLSL